MTAKALKTEQALPTDSSNQENYLEAHPYQQLDFYVFNGIIYKSNNYNIFIINLH